MHPSKPLHEKDLIQLLEKLCDKLRREGQISEQTKEQIIKNLLTAFKKAFGKKEDEELSHDNVREILNPNSAFCKGKGLSYLISIATEGIKKGVELDLSNFIQFYKKNNAADLKLALDKLLKKHPELAPHPRWKKELVDGLTKQMYEEQQNDLTKTPDNILATLFNTLFLRPAPSSTQALQDEKLIEANQNMNAGADPTGGRSNITLNKIHENAMGVGPLGPHLERNVVPANEVDPKNTASDSIRTYEMGELSKEGTEDDPPFIKEIQEVNLIKPQVLKGR